MYTIKTLPAFSAWLNSLSDVTAQGITVARIKRLQAGLMGDTKSIGGGVMELRIHRSPGWRAYFTRRGGQIVVLLAGGIKATEPKDIKRAQALAAEIE